MAKTIHRGAVEARPSWRIDPSSETQAAAKKAQAQAQAALEADPRAREKAERACEDIVKSFKASNNFAENGRAREALEQVVIYKDGLFDPWLTKTARESWIKAYIPEAERRR